MFNRYNSFFFRFNRKFGHISLCDRIKYNKKFENAKYVILMTPIHGNLGDQAIFCAEDQIVSSIGEKMVDIPEIEMVKREKLFADFIPKDKTILIHGGGFLGNIWPKEEYEFRKILTEFKDFKVIVFPQTVTFDISTDEGKAFFEESKKIYEHHKNLLIFVRDERSYNFMKENMSKVNCKLVPDVVTQYELNTAVSERNGILLCMRNDRERNIDKTTNELISSLVGKKYPEEKVTYTDTVIDKNVYPKYRYKELYKKIQQISKSRLVVTDRLHGMIFSAITNTPCIAFNNANKKVEAQYRWIKNNPYIKMVANIDEFKKVLEELDTEQKYRYSCDYAKDCMKPLYNALQLH